MSFDWWINRPSYIKTQIDEAFDEVLRRQAFCERTTIKYGQEYVKKSSTDNILENIISLTEAKDKLNQYYQEYDDAIEEIRAFMYEKLPRKQADILDWRYCHLCSVDRIAEIKHLKKSSVYASCRRALANLREAYDAK